MDGPSGETRTRGILLPKQARYQLRYTRIGKNIQYRRKNTQELLWSPKQPRILYTSKTEKARAFCVIMLHLEEFSPIDSC